MSVKDRVADLEGKLKGLENLIYAMKVDLWESLNSGDKEITKELEGLEERMYKLPASNYDAIIELTSDINTLKEALPDVEDKINSLEKKIENYNPDDFIRGDLHRKCNYLHRCMEGLQLKIKEFEALGARVEELENAEADTRWNAPDNSTKPEKFIKVVDDKSEQHLIRFKDIKVIRSSWDDEEEDGGITFVITLANRVMKSYFDKDTWQHDLNKIEWFIYDDALLLDLTDLVAPDMGVHWNPPSNKDYCCPYEGMKKFICDSCGTEAYEAERVTVGSLITRLPCMMVGAHVAVKPIGSYCEECSKKFIGES